MVIKALFIEVATLRMGIGIMSNKNIMSNKKNASVNYDSHKIKYHKKHFSKTFNDKKSITMNKIHKTNK